MKTTELRIGSWIYGRDLLFGDKVADNITIKITELAIIDHN